MCVLYVRVVEGESPPSGGRGQGGGKERKKAQDRDKENVDAGKKLQLSDEVISRDGCQSALWAGELLPLRQLGFNFFFWRGGGVEEERGGDLGVRQN